MGDIHAWAMGTIALGCSVFLCPNSCSRGASSGPVAKRAEGFLHQEHFSSCCPARRLRGRDMAGEAHPLNLAPSTVHVHERKALFTEEILQIDRPGEVVSA